MILACLFLIVFATVATIDSMYFHVWKYRLHNRPESRFEHLTHAANICLFVPATYLMFCVNAQGLWLQLAIFFLAATLGVELADVFCEGDSRRSLGGLSSLEYAMHFLMAGMRMGMVGAYFASRPFADFTAPAALGESLPIVELVGWCMVIPGSLIAAFHVVLIFTGKRVIAQQAAAGRHSSVETSSALG